MDGRSLGALAPWHIQKEMGVPVCVTVSGALCILSLSVSVVDSRTVQSPSGACVRRNGRDARGRRPVAIVITGPRATERPGLGAHVCTDGAIAIGPRSALVHFKVAGRLEEQHTPRAHRGHELIPP